MRAGGSTAVCLHAVWPDICQRCCRMAVMAIYTSQLGVCTQQPYCRLAVQFSSMQSTQSHMPAGCPPVMKPGGSANAWLLFLVSNLAPCSQHRLPRLQDEVPSEDTWEQRCYVTVDLLFHPHLGTMRSAQFFNACRSAGISFDMMKRTGTAFSLVDAFTSGVLSMQCAGPSPQAAFAEMAKVGCITSAHCPVCQPGHR